MDVNDIIISTDKLCDVYIHFGRHWKQTENSSKRKRRNHLWVYAIDSRCCLRFIS